MLLGLITTLPFLQARYFSRLGVKGNVIGLISAHNAMAAFMDTNAVLRKKGEELIFLHIILKRCST